MLDIPLLKPTATTNRNHSSFRKTIDPSKLHLALRAKGQNLDTRGVANPGVRPDAHNRALLLSHIVRSSVNFFCFWTENGC